RCSKHAPETQSTSARRPRSRSVLRYSRLNLLAGNSRVIAARLLNKADRYDGNARQEGWAVPSGKVTWGPMMPTELSCSSTSRSVVIPPLTSAESGFIQSTYRPVVCLTPRLTPAAKPRLLEFTIVRTAGKSRRTAAAVPSREALSTTQTSCSMSAKKSCRERKQAGRNNAELWETMMTESLMPRPVDGRAASDSCREGERMKVAHYTRIRNRPKLNASLPTGGKKGLIFK